MCTPIGASLKESSKTALWEHHPHLTDDEIQAQQVLQLSQAHTEHRWYGQDLHVRLQDAQGQGVSLLFTTMSAPQAELPFHMLNK